MVANCILNYCLNVIVFVFILLMQHVSNKIVVSWCNFLQIVIYKQNAAFYKTSDLGSSKTFPSVRECTTTALPTLLVVASTLANADTTPTDDVKLHRK